MKKELWLVIQKYDQFKIPILILNILNLFCFTKKHH